MGKEAVVERGKTQREMRHEKSRVGGISQPLDRGNKILDITIYNTSL
jgi:hypothetical protein